jgi:hypothetical protein
MIQNGNGGGRDRSLDRLDARVFGRPMADYEDLLRQRQIATPSGSSDMGPLSSPLTQSDPTTQLDFLSGMYRLLRYLPYDMVMMMRKQLLLIPRENVPIPATGVDIALASAATVSVCSLQIDESFTGFLRWVGFGVSPSSYRANVDWSIKINNTAHPKWGAFVSPADNLATPYEVMLELTRAKSIEIFATNTGGSGCNESTGGSVI